MKLKSVRLAQPSERPKVDREKIQQAVGMQVEVFREMWGVLGG